MGVFDTVAGALTGKKPQANPGTQNQVGYNAQPVPVPDSVRAARAKLDMQAAMAAHADKVHPVKTK